MLSLLLRRRRKQVHRCWYCCNDQTIGHYLGIPKCSFCDCTKSHTKP